MSLQLVDELKYFLTLPVANKSVLKEYKYRINQGKFTQSENEQSHFCAYFAAIDPDLKGIFIGHHKKSGLWLFNGGHINHGENLSQTLNREMDEEWGFHIILPRIIEPSLLTITHINNHPQLCKTHWDIWFFMNFNKKKFKPKEKRLKTEFSKTQWTNLENASNLVKDPATIEAMNYLNRQVFNK